MNVDDLLADLRRHWGSAYDIGINLDGTWVARRQGSRVWLRAESGQELRWLIRRDYDVATGVSPSTRGR